MSTPKTHTMTAAQLRELLDYDPTTGLFVWRVRLSTARGPGDLAGSIKADGYIRIEIAGESFTASHLAWLYMTGAWPTDRIDHEDRHRSNNRWSNLRPATHKQNQENKTSIAASGVCGVGWFKGKWQAVIKHEKVKHYLGRFDTLLDAVAARKAAEHRFFTHHRGR